MFKPGGGAYDPNYKSPAKGGKGKGKVAQVSDDPAAAAAAKAAKSATALAAAKALVAKAEAKPPGIAAIFDGGEADESWIFGVQENEDIVIAAMRETPSSMMVDSGAMLSVCPANFAEAIPLQQDIKRSL